MPDVQVCVVSAGRSGNVPAMEAWCSELGVAWFVPADEASEYRYAGAGHVVGVDGRLVAQRNAVLDHCDADNAVAVMLDDDLRGLALAEVGDTNAKHDATLAEVVGHMLDGLLATGLRMAGIAPTPNAYFCKAEWSTTLFCRANLTVHMPRHGRRYDPATTLKEDYDMTCQHLAAFGGALRANRVLGNFQQRVQKGGLGSYRTVEREQAVADLLVERWAPHIRPHPTRPHEVSLRWRGPAVEPPT